jgi:hypothetical protein
MNINEIKERIKSPVVIIQLISIIVGVIVYFEPQFSEQIKVISTALVSAINLFAGLNNPSDKSNF